MESENAEVDQNTNNSNRDKASNDANPLVFQTPNSNENDLTPYLNLRHHDQLATPFGDPETEVTIDVNPEATGQTPACRMSNSSNDHQYELQGARPKDLPAKPQNTKDSSVNNNLAKDVKISKSVNPSTEEQELRKNKKLKQRDSPRNQFVTSQQEKGINVNNELLVNFKDKQIDKVLKLVCACLNIRNSQTRTLKLRNKHCSSAESKDLDDWYDKVEKKMKEVFFNNIADYVELKGHCNSAVLELIVKPAPIFCTVDMHLYFPSVSSADQAKYTKAVEILRQDGAIGPLPNIPYRTYKLHHKVEGLRNENIDTQFKQITGKHVPNTLANMCSHYISAYGNYKGGVIYYGIEDKKGEVFGIDLSNCEPKNIEIALETKIGGMICGKSITKLKRKTHWDVQYFDIEEDGEGNTIMQNKKIIAVSMCRIPGGVFTAVPESYYVDDDGNVKQYEDFVEWKCQMLTSYIDSPATKGDTHQIEENLHSINDKIEDIRLNSIQSKPISDNSMVNDAIVVGRTVVGEMSSNIEEWDLVENYIYTERYYQKLKTCMETKRCVILKGLKGTGKSELALQYCYSVRKHNPSIIVYKLRCTDTNMFEKSLRDLCKCLPNINTIEEENSQHETLIKLEDAILREMRDREGYQFLLLDDVKLSSKRAVNDFLKKCKRVANVKLIVTTSVSLELDAFTEVVEVNGFSEDEAVEFLKNCPSIENEDKKYILQLAKKFSCNPKGLHIARSYMIQAGLSANGLIKKLNVPLDMLKFEQTIALNETFDETLFSSLVSIIRDMHKKHKQENKEHIFEMILLLQFIEVENIPVVLFAKTSYGVSDFCIDEFIYEIKNSSFGTLYEHDDDRQLNTHDLVKSALQIYMTEMETDVLITNEKLLGKLLRAFFLLMDKDNKHKSDLRRHTLLVPHARAVLEKLKAGIKRTQKGAQNVDHILQVIYLKDIIGYTYSFNYMLREASEYFEDAKKDLFGLLNVAKTFQVEFEELVKADYDIFQHESLVHEKTKQLYSAIVEFINNANHLPAVKKVGEDYVIHKYRNAEDAKILARLLEKPELAEATHLIEDEYVQLSHRGYTVPLEWLSKEFLFELVISVLHTYGRRLFYLSVNRDMQTAKIFFSYLAVANELSKMKYISENRMLNFGPEHGKIDKNRLSSVLTERSKIQYVLDFLCKESTVNASHLNDYIAICESRLEERVNYYEFGVLKVLHDKCDHFTAIWVRMILGCYINLIEIEKTAKVRDKALKWGENLSAKMKSMEDNTCYPSLVCSLGDLYFATGQILKSERCFEEILPKYATVEDKSETSEISLQWFERKACISYIKCRLNRSGDTEQNFEADTLHKLEAYKLLFQRYEIELKELEEIESLLKARLQVLCSDK